MSVYVTLTPSEMHLSKRAAVARQRNKDESRAANNRKASDRDDTETHLVGLRAEIAVANLMNAAPDTSLVPGSDGGVDLVLRDGRTVQVKCRRPHPTQPRHFALLSTDLSEFRANIGVLVYETNSPRTFEIVGWITRERFAEIAVPMQFGPLGMRLAVPREKMEPFRS